jgi:hypothetical protein
MAGDGGRIILYSQPNIYGTRFNCSARTGAHLDSTKRALAARATKDGKSYSLRIIQGCYNSSVDASAGTHDKDACLDVQIVGMTWAEAQRFLRAQGWAAFWRKPSQGPWSDHIHMVSLPPYKLAFVAPVGIYVPGQVNDYYAKLNGLSSHLPDKSWHPDPIKATIFNYSAWIEELTARERLRNLAKRALDLKATIDATKRLIARLAGKN